jgi:hypothetical protein
VKDQDLEKKLLRDMFRLAVFIFLVLLLFLVLERVDGGPWSIVTAAIDLARDVWIVIRNHHIPV